MKLGKNELTASLAILLSGIMGGLAPIAAKIALRDLSPLTVLFIRISIMVIALFPILISSRSHLRLHWKRLLILGLFWTGNVTLFIIGVKYTTSAVSQVMYAMVPIVVIILSAVFLKQKTKPIQIIGITLGLIGAILLLILSKESSNQLGSLYGNFIILLATFCWALYLVYSKRLSSHLSSIQLTTASAVVAWAVSFAFLVATEQFTWVSMVRNLTLIEIESLLFLGLIVGCVMIFLFQWGIKYGSAFLASTNVYVATLVSAVAGFYVFGEKLTGTSILGGLLLLTGLLFASVLPLLRKRT